MNSQPNFDNKDRDIQFLLKKIIDKKQGGDSGKFDDMLKNLPSTGDRVDNFLGGQKLAQNFNNPVGLPQDLYEATMRQYGRKEFGDYTTDDMKLIIEANKKGLL